MYRCSSSYRTLPLIASAGLGLALGACATAEGPLGVGGDTDSGVIGIAADAGATADAPQAPRPIFDAAPGTPDAAPLPDAAPPPPPPIDAGPSCTNSTQNVLTNGDFDAGSGVWVETSGSSPQLAIITDEFSSPHSGTHVAWLGGYLPANIDVVYQQFTLPGDATDVRITGSRMIGSQESGLLAWDAVEVQLRTTSGALLEVLGGFDNTDANAEWTDFDFTPSADYAGQTLRIYLVADGDDTNNTNFLFDSLAVSATFCN